ncbi:MAG: hypothetical protein DPW09_10255 [Anaerolineae bacterium]|nr:hypothetical protein [Anaerolineales bacterium]MCQ3973815.1 hypothetical protein [Anaerolineae bacterium]
MKKKPVTCCLSILLAPLLVCGLYSGLTTLYLALTEIPYDYKRVDAYTLFPAETTGAALVTNFNLLTEDPRLETILPYHTPHIYVESLLASAQLQFEDVSQLTLLEIDYNSAAILIYTPKAQAVFDALQTQSFGQVDRYNENVIYRITSPHAEGWGDAASSKNLEPWAWALVNEGLLVVGGITTVENILDIHYGRRPNLVEARPIMKTVITLLRDKPNVYYGIRREEDIALSKTFAWVAGFFLGPFYGLLEAFSVEAGAFAAENIEDGCISIMASQMPSRTSAAIITSPFKVLTGVGNLQGPNSGNWYADSMETIRINNVKLIKLFWKKENCYKDRSVVFPQ